MQIGGRLFSSDESSVVTGETTSAKAKSMKASASLSMSYGAFSASASASGGTNDQNQGGKKSADSVTNISWEATGGDTLLCNK